MIMMKYHLLHIYEANLLPILIPSLKVFITLRQPLETPFVVAGVRSPFRGGKFVHPLTDPEMIEMTLLILVMMVTLMI